MNFYNESELSSMKLAEITDRYNLVAKKIGVKAVKKFRDKATAVNRTLQAQEMLQEDIQDNAEVEAVKPAPKAKKEKAAPAKKGSRFDLEQAISVVKGEPKEGTIEATIFSAIQDDLCATAGEVVDYIVKYHKRPRSGLGVDAQYAIHSIKWFVRKGHIKLG